MGYAEESLLLGRGFAHSTNIAAFATNAAQYAPTNSVRYNATPGSNTNLFVGMCRYVELCNDDASNFVTVTVAGNTNVVSVATIGDGRVYPRTSRFFRLEEGNNQVISVKADTASCAGSLVWYK